VKLSHSKSKLKAVIVAGGEGSRLHPFTNYTHKTLLPLFDRPVIDFALATIRQAGIKDITIIANRHLGQIAKHVGVGLAGERIHYVIEDHPMGVANALSLARPHVEGHRMLLYFSDNITTWDFSSDGDKFRKATTPPGAVLLAREVENPWDFGVCDLDENGRIIDILEKPADPPSNLAIGGIYLFDERFWSYLDEEVGGIEGGFSISDMTKRYVRDGEAVVHNIGEGTWIDCGTPLNLLKASNMASEGIISADTESRGS
jgi:glucose-1-phosphate thymidylyltransferase